jgi:hypothetical protein
MQVVVITESGSAASCRYFMVSIEFEVKHSVARNSLWIALCILKRLMSDLIQ